MEASGKKPTTNFMRGLHRDIGFLVVGLTIIYAASGVVLVYRDTPSLKHDIQINKTLAPNLEPSELGKALRMKDLAAKAAEDGTIRFKNGWYDKATGAVQYTTQDFIFPLNKLAAFHKASAKSPTSWANAIYGLLLCFMALSSFWMHRPGTNRFRRGVFVTSAGIVVAILFLLI